MAITTGADLIITPQQFLPAMSAEPLLSALRNTNHLYKFFRPALASFIPLDEIVTRDTSYVVAVTPSVDSIIYAVQHRLLPDPGWPGAGTVTIQIDALSGTNPLAAGTTVYGPTPTAALVASTWATIATPLAAGALLGATMLRVTYTAAAFTYLTSHVLVFPDPGAPAAGIKACGFRPFDDSLLLTAGAAINTEMVNRTRRNSLAILRDRRQCVMSLVQPYVSGPGFGGARYVVAGSTNGPVQQLLGKATASIPGQTKITLTAYCLAEVDGGATAGLVRVHIPGHGDMFMDATTTLFPDPAVPADVVKATKTITLPGTLTDTVPFEVWVTGNTNQITYLQSIVVLWRPGD
jgi:hypothetical protein